MSRASVAVGRRARRWSRCRSCISEPYPLHILIIVLIWSFMYTSWSVMGRFGLVSLGHGGFMGIGAYVTALLWNYFGLTPWLGIPVAMAAPPRTGAGGRASPASASASSATTSRW